jgi:peptidyl-prolyl cis-trans isomerase A (cyclophilin A)
MRAEYAFEGLPFRGVSARNDGATVLAMSTMWLRVLPLAFPFALLACSPAASAPATPRADSVTPSTDVAEAPPTNTAALLDPSLATQTAPDVFRAVFATSKGAFTVEVHREWAPVGADRFYNLVAIGYFDGARFFRVMKGFMAQFGINADPAVNARWHEAHIKDDPVKQSNVRGAVTFATSGPDERSTQVFISFDDNSGLDAKGFAPFGRVVDGMSVVDALYDAYGDGPPTGQGPDQGRIQDEGNSYLTSVFPELDWIKTARLAR